MKFEKGVVVNIGQYQSVRLAVSDAPNFRVCDAQLVKELQKLDIPLNDRIKNVLEWDDHQ